jgi:hypothetical protein
MCCAPPKCTASLCVPILSYTRAELVHKQQLNESLYTCGHYTFSEMRTGRRIMDAF